MCRQTKIQLTEQDVISFLALLGSNQPSLNCCICTQNLTIATLQRSDRLRIEV